MLNKISLRIVFILCFGFISVLVLTYTVLITYNVQSVLEESLIRRSKNETANFVRTQTTKHIPQEVFAESDVVKTQSIFDSFFVEIDTDEILRIKVWNPEARILASNDSTIVGKIFSDNKPFQEALRGDVSVVIKAPLTLENATESGYGQLMEVYVPIMYEDGKVAGVVETYTILDTLNNDIKEARNELLIKIMAVSIPTLTLLGVLLIVLYRNILHRINALVVFTRKIGTAKFNEKISIDSHDEISEIALAINKMAESLSKTTLSKSELEEQVQLRTSELKGKMSEVEQMNAHMVARELKMVELKDKIAELEGRLGQEK